MTIVPAAGLGLVAVFFAGATLVYLLLDTLAKKQTPLAARLPFRLTEQSITRIALAGGGVAAAVTLLLLIALPQSRTGIWIGLTVLGIGLGVITFILRLGLPQPRPAASTKPPRAWPRGEKPRREKPRRAKPAESAGAPPKSEGTTRPTDSAQAPRAHEYKPNPSTPSASTSDPYRDLMARVKYDQREADRLIAEERKRRPTASLDELCRSIIARLEPRS